MSVYFVVPYTRYQGQIQGGAIMAIAPSKTCESNFIHHDFTQFGKRYLRTVAKRFSIGGLCVSEGDLILHK